MKKHFLSWRIVKFIIGITFVLLIFSLSTYSQEEAGIIQGKIVDNQRNPLMGIRIKVQSIDCDCSLCKKPSECTCCVDGYDARKIIQTDKTGTFSFKVFPGTYTLMFIIEEIYIGNSLPIVVITNETTTINFNLSLQLVYTPYKTKTVNFKLSVGLGQKQ